MPTVSLTGADTLVIAGRVLNNVADADWCSIVYNNDLAAAKRGKDGNAIFASNSMGPMAEVTIRLIRASADDKYLDALLQLQLRDFASFVLLSGQFTKRVGNGRGAVSADTGQLSGGIFTRNVDSKSNAEGDTEQSVAIYRLMFANSDRALF